MKLEKKDIIDILKKLGDFIQEKDLTLILNKKHFGLKTSRNINKYIDELEKDDSDNKILFSNFIENINKGIRYVINEKPDATEEDLFKFLELLHHVDEVDEEKEDASGQKLEKPDFFDLNIYGEYEGETFRNYVYKQLSKHIIEIIKCSYGNIEEEIKLIKRENYILKSLNYDILTYRDVEDIKEVDFNAIKLIFEIENLEEEKFEFEVTHDRLNFIIKKLSEISKDMEKLEID